VHTNIITSFRAGIRKLVRLRFSGIRDRFDLIITPSNNRGLISGSMDGFWSLLLQVINFKVFWFLIPRHGLKIFQDECYCLSSVEFILLIKCSLSTGFLMKCSCSISGNTLVTSWATSSAEQNIILILGLNAFILWNS
jgi:hypothetical protein